MNMKNILLFVGGLAVGGAAGVFGSMKYFQNKYQKQYEEDHAALEEYYHRTDEYARGDHEEVTEEEFEDDGNPSTETNSRPGGRMSPEERAAIKEKLNRNWEGTTNYAGMYRKKNGYTEEKLAEVQHPLDQGEAGEEDPEDLVICANCSQYDPEDSYCKRFKEKVSADDTCDDFENLHDSASTPEEDAFDYHQKNKNRDPKIISADTYSELPAHIDKKVLYLYAWDEVVVDEDNEDEPIEEPERLIGDALTKYGFIDNDELIIFVMNYSLDTCYEIQKVDGSWSDTH